MSFSGSIAAVVFLFAVGVNYAWELAQAPLFLWPGESRGVWWHCFVASLGDGLIVLTMYAVGAAIFHRRDWIEQPGPAGHTFTFASGLVVAVAIEWFAVNVLGRWEYLPQMPRMPLLGIGIVPVIQMLVLPPLIFRLAALALQRDPGSGSTK